jgi:DNA-binding HxlR family transcriptional regulator
MVSPTSARPVGRPRQLAPVSDVLGECVSDDEDGRRIRDVLDRVGDKWSMLIIVRLREGGGTLRFGQLSRAVAGISQRMLTLTLRHLERDGLVVRTTYDETPPRVEYTLTDLGRTLTDPVIELAKWALINYPAIERNRARHDAAIETHTFASATGSSPA